MPWWRPTLRWKRVVGDELRSRRDGRRATEVVIAAEVLNRMLRLGRPEYVRLARRETRVGLSAPVQLTHATVSIPVRSGESDPPCNCEYPGAVWRV